jgi:hypothetical protein
MRLIHHDKNVVLFDPDRIYPITDRFTYFKPNGLWVSDEDNYGWSHWCNSEQWGTQTLNYEHLVELYPDNNILFISTVEDLDKFHEEFKTRLGNWAGFGDQRDQWLDWTRVYNLWQGIIITPYFWERRLDYMWYYGWDCASGCIWDLRAIRTFRPLLKQLKDHA